MHKLDPEDSQDANLATLLYLKTGQALTDGSWRRGRQDNLWLAEASLLLFRNSANPQTSAIKHFNPHNADLGLLSSSLHEKKLYTSQYVSCTRTKAYTGKRGISEVAIWRLPKLAGRPIHPTCPVLPLAQTHAFSNQQANRFKNNFPFPSA